MKIKVIYTTLFLSCIFLASCQELQQKKFTAEVTVVDLDGKPVESATILGGNEKLTAVDPIPQAEYETVKAITTKKGEASITLKRYSEWPSGVLIQKDGYYTTRQAIQWPQVVTAAESTHATCLSILKEIKSPIPMYAYSNSGGARRTAKLNQFNVRYSYDLMLADALPPLGNGKNADFHFTLVGTYEDNKQFDMQLNIEFPNQGDGIVVFESSERTGFEEATRGSALQSDYEAPESGYMNQIIKNYKRSLYFSLG
jgi:hypothetical protein